MANLGRYHTKKEKEYFSLRNKNLKTIDKEYLLNNPFVFANRQLVTEMLVRIELFKMITNVAGHIVECGVANGNNLMLFSHMSSIFEPFAINRKIIGFDTFSGFRNIKKKDPKDISEKDFSKVSLTNLKKAIELYDFNRPIGHMNKVELVKGDATKTIAKYVKDHPELTIALLYLDFDLYKPTKIALKHLLPLITKGGILVLDEFNYEKFSGETLAIKETVELNNMEFKKFSFSPFEVYCKI